MLISFCCFFAISSDKVNRIATMYSPADVTYDVPVNNKMNELLSNIPDEYIEEDSIKFYIDVTKAGIVPNSAEAAYKNVKKINKILKSAKEYTQVIFPDGIYYLDSSFGGIKLKNKSNIIICGRGNVKFINTSYSPSEVKKTWKYNSSNIFNINGCKNIKIENIAIDFKSHTSADGIITKVADGKTYFSVYPEFLEKDKSPLVGGEFVTSVLTAGENVFSQEAWADSAMQLGKIGKNGEFFVPVTIGNPGDRICCRFTSGTYASPAFYIQNTSGFAAKNLSCYSCPSVVFFAPYGNSDFSFSGIKIMTEQNRKQLLASNEDCIHIEGLSGKLFVTDSIFCGIGDDALNVHSSVAVVKKISNNKLKLIRGYTGKLLGKLWAVEGDVIEFFDKNYNSLGTAKIKGFNGNEAVFDKIPDGVTAQSYLQNLSFNPDTTIKNCKVEFGRARAFLLQTKNAVVSECSFKDIRLSAILISPDFDYWYEAGFGENVLINKNDFENCTAEFSYSNFGIITVNTCHDNADANLGRQQMHKNISIFENNFIRCKENKLTANSVQNLKSDIDLSADN